MDNKSFIAQYAASETARINQRLKEMVESPTPPSDELRESVIGDIETTLSRLRRALSYVMENLDDDKEETLQ